MQVRNPIVPVCLMRKFYYTVICTHTLKFELKLVDNDRSHNVFTILCIDSAISTTQEDANGPSSRRDITVHDLPDCTRALFRFCHRHP